ncbi:hypothetical protein Q1695_014310 [Nippostrongylus brasiliensis]|nr:hypothetical protein Q1695_014310 [Nippostrongylus brasiliensis]
MRTNLNILLRGTAAICLLFGMTYPKNRTYTLHHACFVSRNYTYKSGEFVFGSLIFGGTSEEVEKVTYCRLIHANGTKVDVAVLQGDFEHQEGETYAVACYCRAQDYCNTWSSTFHDYVRNHPQVNKSKAFKTFYESFNAERGKNSSSSTRFNRRRPTTTTTTPPTTTTTTPRTHPVGSKESKQGLDSSGEGTTAEAPRPEKNLDVESRRRYQKLMEKKMNEGQVVNVRIY